MTARILVQATATREVAELLQFAWRFARWLDGDVDPYVAEQDPVDALHRRIGRAQGDDLVIAELPDDPAARGALARLLMQKGQRALLLPPRRETLPWTFGGWAPAIGAAPAVTSESALLAIVAEQHLRWSGAGIRGCHGDPIATHAVEAVFDGRSPTWPAPRATGSDRRRAYPLLLRSLTADAGHLDAFRSGRRDTAWIVIPQRTPCRLADAWDDGVVIASLPGHRGQGAVGTISVVVAADGQRWRVTVPGAAEDAEVVIDISGRSLLDPELHGTWQGLRELLAMPRLRHDLLAARDVTALRSVLLLDEETLAASTGPEPG